MLKTFVCLYFSVLVIGLISRSSKKLKSHWTLFVVEGGKIEKNWKSFKEFWWPKIGNLNFDSNNCLLVGLMMVLVVSCSSFIAMADIWSQMRWSSQERTPYFRLCCCFLTQFYPTTFIQLLGKWTFLALFIKVAQKMTVITIVASVLTHV